MKLMHFPTAIPENLVFEINTKKSKPAPLEVTAQRTAKHRFAWFSPVYLLFAVLFLCLSVLSNSHCLIMWYTLISPFLVITLFALPLSLFLFYGLLSTALHSAGSPIFRRCAFCLCFSLSSTYLSNPTLAFRCRFAGSHRRLALR